MYRRFFEGNSCKLYDKATFSFSPSQGPWSLVCSGAFAYPLLNLKWIIEKSLNRYIKKINVLHTDILGPGYETPDWSNIFHQLLLRL